MFIIRYTLNGKDLDGDFHYNLTPAGEIEKFKNAKMMACGAERISSEHKNILRFNTRSFIFKIRKTISLFHVIFLIQF